MKTTFFIIILSFGIRLVAQSDLNYNGLRIFNADSLLNIAQSHGINALEEMIIDPIDIMYVDSSYAKEIIDLEFKTGLFGKHYDNKDITVCYSPDLTLELAEDFNNKKAAEKLFEYYCSLPKLSRSDTIYAIYYLLDDYLKVLIRFKSSQLIEKLKDDFQEWTIIAQNSPIKKYPTIEEMRRRSFEESMKFQTSDLIIDCNYVLLQIAGALNYLKVEGFNDALLDKLKMIQTRPFASNYNFPKPIITTPTKYSNWRKKIEIISTIKDFRKDYKKLETVILNNFENCCESRICQIIEKGPKAFVTMARNNGYDFYTVSLEYNNIIIIELISIIIE